MSNAIPSDSDNQKAVSSAARRNRIYLIGLVILAGFLFAAIYHYVLGVYRQMPYPANTFLFRPEDRFNDFRNLYNVIANPEISNPLTQYSTGWFQFGLFIPALFASFLLPVNVATALYLLGFAGAFIGISRKYLAGTSTVETWKNVLFISVLSYPFLFILDRGNLEAAVFLLVFLFVHSLQQKRYTLAMIWLGLAVASKPFPFVFIILLLQRKRFGHAVGVLVISLVLNAIAFYIRFGAFSPQDTTGIQNYQETYVIGNQGLYFGHSLWGVTKICMAIFCGPHIPTPAAATIYFWLAAAGFLMMSYWIWKKELPLWQQVTLLTCAMNLLPFVSADYKLIHFFVPLLLYANSTESAGMDRFFSVLFGLLMVPKAYGSLIEIPEVSIGVVINPLLMLGLVTAIALAQKRPTIHRIAVPHEAC